ncbi:MAG: hypothetical protein JW745_08970 [Sedimentisphaerales bacterium]|nr:hypothetical protein [Sedimentisphaerales bacterium]
MAMNFDPEYIRKLILEANQLLTNDNIDQKSRSTLQKCLFSIQADDRTFSVCGNVTDENE